MAGSVAGGLLLLLGLAAEASASVPSASGAAVPRFQLGGYLENWVAAGDVPGPFNVVYYAFLTLDQQPDPWSPRERRWDGAAIYGTMTRADISKVMYQTDPTWENPHEWQRVKIQDAIDRCKGSGALFMWSIGGWSDLTKTISDEQIPAFAELAVQLLRFGGDGIDLDWEHVSQYGGTDPALFQQQRAVIGKTLSALRGAMDAAGMQDKHLSYTTRWNCFWRSSDAAGHANAVAFASDGECLDTLSNMTSAGDVRWINLMMYDAAPGSAFEGAQHFTQEHYAAVLQAAEAAGVPKDKVVMGFEPGHQANNGIWEGFDIDFDVIGKMSSEGYGGAFWWAMNEQNSGTNAYTPISTEHAWQGSVGANAHYTADTFANRA